MVVVCVRSTVERACIKIEGRRVTGGFGFTSFRSNKPGGCGQLPYLPFSCGLVAFQSSRTSKQNNPIVM
eukprot:scaffold2659_cov66-Skeletonema_dohrnii-CCMP3373.AAC.2